MFYTVTKKTIIVILIVALVAIAPVTIGISASYASPKERITLVIDAGHGGIDEGVHGTVTGIAESEINLKVSKFLKAYFADAGFKVVMTRTTDAGLYGIKTKGFKTRDMNNRKKIIERENPDIVLSVHMNYYTSPVRRGLQVFYTNTTASKNLADEIQRIANININNPITGRNLINLYGDYFMLKCTAAPSVIVECGFLSNPEDEKLLCSDAYLKELAYYIFSGVISYLNCYV
ncbi:MAG: N-acetylmuramoyl-L-alanine amidase family protein [Christensenellales bacterium]|jgi:N-acetylmuramoyl-L-alanine amidase